MTIAILDPFSGISGDMTLGALVDVGLDADWLRALPAQLGLEGVTVRVARVRRAGIACTKIDFDIPPQPHGRHIGQIRELVARAAVPGAVQARADAAFKAIAEAEGEVHGMPPEEVHLHEVGAVDAILDVVGAVWGFERLGVAHIYCGAVALGDGSVRAAHGTLPVPAPATLKLLQGLAVRPGPEGSGELVTPTGAALVRILAEGPPPAQYVPLRSGFGAGTRDPSGRPNALRLVLAEPVIQNGLRSERLWQLAADVDDMDGEYLAGAAEALRAAGALDVILVPTIMKKGRPGTRIEVLADETLATRLQELLFSQTTTLGVRASAVERRSLAREMRSVSVLGFDVRVKVAVLPDGGFRLKPEFDDVSRIAAASGTPLRDVFGMAVKAAERLISDRVE